VLHPIAGAPGRPSRAPAFLDWPTPAPLFAGSGIIAAQVRRKPSSFRRGKGGILGGHGGAQTQAGNARQLQADGLPARSQEGV
jgi:hypothetical protein